MPEKQYQTRNVFSTQKCDCSDIIYWTYLTNHIDALPIDEMSALNCRQTFPIKCQTFIVTPHIVFDPNSYFFEKENILHLS